MPATASQASLFLQEDFVVEDGKVTYTDAAIRAKYVHTETIVEGCRVRLRQHELTFETQRAVPRTGVMLVGWGGNNGSTITAAILANRLALAWNTKEGRRESNFVGSLTQASTVRLGEDAAGRSVYIPFHKMLPMVNPVDLVIGGWDISSRNLAEAMVRAQVLDYDLQRQLIPHLEGLKPLPSIYCPDYIALNQSERADNVLGGTKASQLGQIRADIRAFKQAHSLDKVIVLWTANTERFSSVEAGLNDTAAALLASIDADAAEVAPSTIFAVASILEGSAYINGSPQNTFVPGVVELAEQHGVFIGGDDFKSGQTKIKSVLVDFLVSAGIKPRSIVSYNHLGNNDGLNLSAPEQFRSKEISKSNVVDDMVAANRILYKGENNSGPDHCVVIKYVPYVGDSKRAMDEYISEIFMGGQNTIAMHNTCEDSLLASPIIIDLVLITELCQRIKVASAASGGRFESFHPVLSLLSYLLKAPLVPHGAPVVNALAAQRHALVNVFRACSGLPVEDNMHLEHKIPAMMAGRCPMVAEEQK